MAWMTESQMVKAFSEAMKSQKTELKKDFVILHESKTNYGRPDVMIVEYDQAVVKERRVKSALINKVPFTPGCAYAMAYLSEAKLAKLENLQTFLRCGKNQLNSIIKYLSKRNLIYVYKESIRARKLEEIFHINRVLVFEAKLDKWHDAIMQAERHLWFTGASYVILPAEKKKILESAREECLRKGIGLISFSKEGVIECLVDPPDKYIYKNHFSWMLNEEVIQKKPYGARRVQSINR